MSTDLYGVRIVDLCPDENKLKIKIFVVYYDIFYKSHYPIPENPSFFLKILLEKDQYNSFGISKAQIEDINWIKANTPKYIKSTRLLTTLNFPLTNYNGLQDFYFETNGKWLDEDKLVQADFELQLTDRKYLDPFKSGMSWGSSCFAKDVVNLKPKKFELNGDNLYDFLFHAWPECKPIEALSDELWARIYVRFFELTAHCSLLFFPSHCY